MQGRKLSELSKVKFRISRVLWRISYCNNQFNPHVNVLTDESMSHISDAFKRRTSSQYFSSASFQHSREASNFVRLETKNDFPFLKRSEFPAIKSGFLQKEISTQWPVVPLDSKYTLYVVLGRFKVNLQLRCVVITAN